MKTIQSQLGFDAAKRALAEAKNAVDLERYMESSIAGNNQSDLADDDYDGRPSGPKSTFEAPRPAAAAGEAQEKKRTGGRPKTYSALNAQLLHRADLHEELLSNPVLMAEICAKYKWDGKRHSLGADAAKYSKPKDQPKEKCEYQGGRRPATFMDVAAGEWARLKKDEPDEVAEYERQHAEQEKQMKADYEVYKRASPAQQAELIRTRLEAIKTKKAEAKKAREAQAAQAAA